MKNSIEKRKKQIVIIVFLLSFGFGFSQEKRDSIVKEIDIIYKNKDTIVQKSNPIIFGEFTFGYTNGSYEGAGFKVNLHYQRKNDLFTFRYGIHQEFKNLRFFLIFPIAESTQLNEEYSLLYGKRYIEDGFSYHFSGGISYNVYTKEDSNTGNETVVNYIGMPLEFGISWFKDKKQPFRVFYGLIPVGKPTAFGRSFGFKLYANINKNSYFGIGLNFGLGYHKKY